MRSPSSAIAVSRDAAEQFGDAVEIDAAGLVQRDGERVRGASRSAASAGGWSTRSVKIGPCRAVPLSRS